MIPQIIVIGLFLFSICHSSYEYGKNKNGKNLFTSILAVTIMFGLLLWGGYFNVFFN